MEPGTTRDIEQVGSESALEVLYRAEYEPMVRLAFTLVGSNEQAEDLVQESFVEVSRRLDEIRNPGGYLRTAVVSRCRSALRRRRIASRYEPELPPSISAGPSELWDVLDKLTDDQRIAVVLRYWAGYRAAEIAKLIDILCVDGQVAPATGPRHPPKGARGMSALTDRIKRDLDEIAAIAEPSPTAWQQIERRIAVDRASRPDTAVVVNLDVARRRGQRSWLLAVVAAVLVAVAVPIYLATDRGQNVTTDEPPPPSTTGPAEEWSTDATGPGTFQTTIIEPGFTVTLGEAWSANEPETVDSWSVRLPQADQPALSRAYVWVVDLDADTADGYIADAVERGFSFSEPVATQIDGLAGERYDVLGGSLDLLPGSAGAYVHAFTPHQTWRLTIVEVGDRVVAIAELVPSDPADEPDPDEIEATQTLTAEIVATIRWRDG